MTNDLWIEWPKTSDAESVRTLLANEYNDHGAWARHYSTVRMTLGTFFLSAATGIIYARWDKPELKTFVLALITLGIGATLFLAFSWLTFRSMDRQRSIVIGYRKALGHSEFPKQLPSLMKKWDGGILCILFVLVFTVFDFWWWRYSQPASGKTTEFNIPIKVQVGGTPGGTAEIPVKITVP